MFTAGETVTVIRPPERDRVGDRPGADAEHTLEGCGIVQTSSAQATDRRNTVSTEIELLCPPRADIRAGDKVRFADGSLYTVDGRPWTPHSPLTGWEPGCTVRLKGVTDAE